MDGDSFFSGMKRLRGGNDEINAPLSFLYVKNPTNYEFKQDFTFTNLRGKEVIFPQTMMEGAATEISIPAGEDHLIILRNTDAYSSYSYTFSYYYPSFNPPSD